MNLTDISYSLMKKQFQFIVVILLSLTTSCKKYLDTVPTDFLVPETYYSNETQITAALMATYSELGNTNESTYSRFLSLEAPASNDENFYRTVSTFASFYNADAGYAKFSSCWATLYSGINRANSLLENVDKANATQATRDVIRGEALFLRAYYHFILTAYWGDVPLKLASTKSPTDVDIVRTPSADIYKKIIEDMTTAEGLVNTITNIGNPGRISKTAAEGILARVCLNAAGRLNDPSYYVQARTWAAKCIASNLHSLNPDYRQVFINHSADKYDLKESMWEVEFTGTNATVSQEYERFGSTIGITNNADAAAPGFMQGIYVSTAPMFNLYLNNDLRRDWVMAPYYYTSNDAALPIISYRNTYIWGRPVAKWRRDYQPQPKVKNFGSTNWPLLRYSDVLLMFAEAENEVNGPTSDAYNAINLVRQRAFGTGSKVSSVTITSANGGSGYTTIPLVTFSPSAAANGANNAATAYATITGGKVTSITTTSPGAFYSAVPTITIAGTTGTGAIATATITTININTANLASGLDKIGFFNAIKDERSRELCFEGLRKLDLIRWGIFIPTMKAMAATISATAPSGTNSTLGYPGLATTLSSYTNVSDRDVLFPIPTQESTLNKLIGIQNLGW